jgi:hypothetical protein
MKLLLVITLSLLAVSVAVNKILVEATAYQEDRREKEIQRIEDSLSKCNGKIKTHVCYP